MEYRHEPVMLDEALAYLAPGRDKNYIDATLGGAGYSLAIAGRIGKGIVLGIDLDQLAIANADELIKQKKIKNLVIANDNFANLEKIVLEKFNGQKPEFYGIVFDLGLSSAQLADRSRGFSFAYDTPLIMSFGPPQGGGSKTAGIVNNWRERELAKIFWDYGEEKFAGRIARAIVGARLKKKIETTGELVKIIEGAIPASYRKKPGIHFATRVFQALRIATNEELTNLEIALAAASKLIEPGGRIVVVSYHSLEDRIVKNFFRSQARGCVCPSDLPVCVCGRESRLKVLTKKPVKPAVTEVEKNPRARSAKLRAAEII